MIGGRGGEEGGGGGYQKWFLELPQDKAWQLKINTLF